VTPHVNNAEFKTFLNSYFEPKIERVLRTEWEWRREELDANKAATGRRGIHVVRFEGALSTGWRLPR
jgi:hypothetical protein